MAMMVEAHAKINWTLEVLGARADGFHDIRSIVLPVHLHDVVTIEDAPDITCMTIGMELPQEINLAYRAAVALREAVDAKRGAHITIEKQIPPGAGLGGGSADAAAVLNGLAELWGLNLPEEVLVGIAANIGSDVPALTLGGAVLMEGRGERVTRLDAEALERLLVPADGLPDPDDIVLSLPGIFASTAAVYREFRADDCGKGPNDLQPAAIRLYPEIGCAISALERQGLKRVTMSGSGSAVYGVRNGF